MVCITHEEVLIVPWIHCCARVPFDLLLLQGALGLGGGEGSTGGAAAYEGVAFGSDDPEYTGKAGGRASEGAGVTGEQGDPVRHYLPVLMTESLGVVLSLWRDRSSSMSLVSFLGAVLCCPMQISNPSIAQSALILRPCCMFCLLLLLSHQSPALLP